MKARHNLPFFERTIGYNGGSGYGHQGFGGSGDKGSLFSDSCEALVIIFSDLGSNLIVRGIMEALQKIKKTNFKNRTLKEKKIFRLTFLYNLVNIDGSYRSNTIVNTELSKNPK